MDALTHVKQVLRDAGFKVKSEARDNQGSSLQLSQLEDGRIYCTCDCINSLNYLELKKSVPEALSAAGMGCEFKQHYLHEVLVWRVMSKEEESDERVLGLGIIPNSKSDPDSEE